jgi:Uma2 family endonuclease
MKTSSSDMDRRCTREEFRSWCALQPRGRYERVDGRIVAMAPERGARAGRQSGAPICA